MTCAFRHWQWLDRPWQSSSSPISLSNSSFTPWLLNSLSLIANCDKIGLATSDNHRPVQSWVLLCLDNLPRLNFSPTSRRYLACCPVNSRDTTWCTNSYFYLSLYKNSSANCFFLLSVFANVFTLTNPEFMAGGKNYIFSFFSEQVANRSIWMSDSYWAVHFRFAVACKFRMRYFWERETSPIKGLHVSSESEIAFGVVWIWNGFRWALSFWRKAHI